ncbi:uncharacterized protein LOC114534009 [Dendronephthya gigantea]|uniref:uncharacterized protein LOC114534009 n=1 Tax=Dendronephthya gigantea TaxID=151771 RepID=UPI00106C60DF|nr:uncharacterized protein LOC114534009 [Dendronephthya gigantea]
MFKLRVIVAAIVCLQLHAFTYPRKLHKSFWNYNNENTVMYRVDALHKRGYLPICKPDCSNLTNLFQSYLVGINKYNNDNGLGKTLKLRCIKNTKNKRCIPEFHNS